MLPFIQDPKRRPSPQPTKDVKRDENWTKSGFAALVGIYHLVNKL